MRLLRRAMLVVIGNKEYVERSQGGMSDGSMCCLATSMSCSWLWSLHRYLWKKILEEYEYAK